MEPAVIGLILWLAWLAVVLSLGLGALYAIGLACGCYDEEGN